MWNRSSNVINALWWRGEVVAVINTILGWKCIYITKQKPGGNSSLHHIDVGKALRNVFCIFSNLWTLTFGVTIDTNVLTPKYWHRRMGTKYVQQNVMCLKTVFNFTDFFL